MGESVPKKFGKCIVVRQLGEGGSALVLLARHEGLNMPVAVKVLRKGLSESKPRYAARFLREARIAARLEHPNIVRVIDCGVEDGFHYMVMDYVDGPDYLQKIKRQPEGLEWREASQSIVQAALGLSYAASRDVIHRDVKPSNLMIDSRGRVRVTDLGLAKMTIKGMVELTQEIHAVGTPNYMSPEQIRAPHRLDLRTDIYSLGATFYHLVCGQPPFAGRSPIEVVAKHLTEKPVPPIERRRSLPPALSSIICKMMAKSPEERYQDYGSLRQDLENLLEGKEVAAKDFKATQPSAQEEEELLRVLGELNLQSELRVEDEQPPLPTEHEEGIEIAGKATPKIDPFGPNDFGAYTPPGSVGREPTVPAPTRPAQQKPKTGLLIALVIVGVLVLLGAVLLAVLYAW